MRVVSVPSTRAIPTVLRGAAWMVVDQDGSGIRHGRLLLSLIIRGAEWILQGRHAWQNGTDPGLYGRKPSAVQVRRCPYLGRYYRETSTSFDVMNSRRAGWPASVAAMPRFMAAAISLGSVTRSP